MGKSKKELVFNIFLVLSIVLSFVGSTYGWQLLMYLSMTCIVIAALWDILFFSKTSKMKGLFLKT